MTTEAKPQLTLQEKAVILREHGLEVIDCLECEPDVIKSIYRHHSSIFFYGDESEGERAVQIFHERGIPVYQVSRHWIYLRRLEASPAVGWELVL